MEKYNNSNPLTMKKLAEMIELTNDKLDTLAKVIAEGKDADNYISLRSKQRDDELRDKIDDCNKILREHADHLFKIDETLDGIMTNIDEYYNDIQENREAIKYVEEKVADSDLRLRYKIVMMAKSGYSVYEIAHALDLLHCDVARIIEEADDESIDTINGYQDKKKEKNEKESEGQYWWIPKKMTGEFNFNGETIGVTKLDNIQDYVDNDEEDNVNHPSHYTDGKYEVIDFIEDYQLPYHVGNAVKYISRAGKKDEDCYIEDLKKAEWYLFRWHNYILCNGVRVFGEYNVKEDRINVADYCKDKKLGFDLTKVINFIVLGRPYDAYIALHSYIGYLEELGHDPD